MDENEIRELQRQYGEYEGIPFSAMQEMIDSGQCWRLEGAAGRAAMDLLEAGVCFLPEQAHRDYYGNKVPGRHMLKPGTKGTLERSIEFWSNEENTLDLTVVNEEE